MHNFYKMYAEQYIISGTITTTTSTTFAKLSINQLSFLGKHSR